MCLLVARRFEASSFPRSVRLRTESLPFQCPAMHVPTHTSRLPEGVAPIPVPDSRREAEVLLVLLNAGLYPRCADEKCADERARRDGKDSTGEGEG